MKLLHYFHGLEPNKKTLPILYSLTVALSIILCVYNYGKYELYQTIVIGILSLDLIGGILFNLTKSTKRFWQTSDVKLKTIFLFAHVLQPLVMAFFLRVDLILAFGLFIYMFLCGFLLLKLNKEWNKIFCVLMTAFGIYIFQEFNFPMQYNWFLIAYLTKLLISFSLKETS